MRFPYIYKGFLSGDVTAVYPNESRLFKPEIKIVVSYNGGKQKLFALVDSGADSCLFPKDVADVLGIDVRSGKQVFYTGIGGHQVLFYFHEIEIFVGKYKFKTMAGFANSGIGTTALLGQRGFFENFKVTFDRKNKYTEIKKSNLIQLLVKKLLPSRILTKLHLD